MDDDGGGGGDADADVDDGFTIYHSLVTLYNKRTLVNPELTLVNAVINMS